MRACYAVGIRIWHMTHLAMARSLFLAKAFKVVGVFAQIIID
jgi:hypothetical protein